MASAKYYSIEVLHPEDEERLVKEGSPARNYGRLSQRTIEELVSLPISNQQLDFDRLFKRKRPWRLRRFVDTILKRPHANAGEVSYGQYTIRVIDAGLAEALGKVATEYEANDLANFGLLTPFDAGIYEEDYWKNFELWKELMGTALINMLPDRPFSLYLFTKDAVGDDVPVYYMELEIDGMVDRHVLVWELDQVLTVVDEDALPHEASKCAEYASAYQKVYFFLNWDTDQERHIEKATVADLPKRQTSDWKRFFDVLAATRPLDALISILVIIATTFVSVRFQDYGVSLIAGIVVSGIAAEEFLPPQSILMGGVARFYANESLALHMYYASTFSLSTKRVLITLLASAGEIVEFVNEGTQPLSIQGRELNVGDIFLIICSLLSCLGLLQSTYAGIFQFYSHSDFPSSTMYSPKAYVEKSGFITQIVEDCRPVEEFCSVYRPILHWQAGIEKRYLGENIDWGSPGAPPSWICYALSTPASARLTTNYIYGDVIKFWLVPLVLIEQFLAVMGGFLIILLDIPVVLVLMVNVLVKMLFGRSMVRFVNTLALWLYAPAQLFLYIVDAYHYVIASILNLKVIHCRKRSTARLYRFPLAQKVRTGRSSNHCWKFGDYLFDENYLRVSDMMMVNPRSSKLGMMEKHRLFYKRHKLIWNLTGGKRYRNPVLSCGDNTVSRRVSYVAAVTEDQHSEEMEAGNITGDPSI